MTDLLSVTSPDTDALPAPILSRLELPWATITRARSDAALPPAAPIPSQDAVCIIVQLRPFISHALWRDGRLVFSGGYPENAVAITDLRDDWRCHHRSAFDNMRVQIAHAEVQRAAREHGTHRQIALANPAGSADPVLPALVRAYLPLLEQPGRAPRMLLEHLSHALLTHVLWAYGKTDIAGRRGSRLSRQQELLAKEWMSEHLLGDVSVDEVAAQCQLSRGHFIKAFKESTGVTPYRWLLAQRIEMARTLLAGQMSIAQVASHCGFSDQSHFTRVFGRLVGTSPARWRKAHGARPS